MKIILIIEDEKILLDSLKEAFDKRGFTVYASQDGKAGLEQALSVHPDLIVLDITLPKLNGLTLLEELRKDPWGNKVPVLILTNNTGTAFVEKAVDHNTFEYLVKTDWTLDDIVSKVQDKLTYQQNTSK